SGITRQFRSGPRAGSEIEAGDIHAFAFLTRVGAEVHEHAAACRRRSARLTEGRHSEDGDGGDEECRRVSGRMKPAHRRIRYRLADEIKDLSKPTPPPGATFNAETAEQKPVFSPCSASSAL